MTSKTSTTSMLGRALPALALAAIALAGCTAAEQEPFADVKVPQGFTFRAVQPVAVSTTVNASLDLNGAQAFELRTPDEQVLFAGGISTAQGVSLNLAVATRHDHLVAVLSPGAGNEQRFAVPIAAVNGTAQATLDLR